MKPISLPYTLSVVILAAGRGSRMLSDKPKVLHPLADKPLLQHVIDTARQLPIQHCYVVHGSDKELLQTQLGQQPLQWVLQCHPRGTGDALRQVFPHLQAEQALLVLYGDVPLITRESLQRLLQAKPVNGLSLLTATVKNPTGYGRICRSLEGEVVGIVEQREANLKQQQITEINSGMMVVSVDDLHCWLNQLSDHNAANEFYLTDIIALAHREGRTISTCQPSDQWEIAGINNRQQLAQLERHYQQLQAERLMQAGVSLLDPQRFDLRGEFIHGRDVVIDSNVILKGRVIVGNRVSIGAGSILSDCSLGDDCEIKPYSLIESSSLGSRCTVGPFARLRPGNQLQSDTYVGNFIEMKQCRLESGSKAGHFGYLGDADIGANVNIGAGTITCNYDGAEKFKTVIEEQVFVGAGSHLVAPVRIGYGATIGAGTTVTQDVAANVLLTRRAKNRVTSDWKRPGIRTTKES